VFLLSVQLTYLYQLLGCKGPYLSSINVGGYNVRQDDGVTVGEAPLTSYVYSSGCLWWRAGFMFQDFYRRISYLCCGSFQALEIWRKVGQIA